MYLIFKQLKNELRNGTIIKKRCKINHDPLADNNPITIQVLGICSALAITAELKASIVMSIQYCSY